MTEEVKIKRLDFFWNVMGSLCNAASSVILLMVVTRANGKYDAGIFSIAFATAQLMLTIGAFEVRAYQSTDVEEKFKFTEYFTFRVITCSLMMIITLVYIIQKGYTGYKAFVIFLICFYKMIDALSDVFQGLFQLRERLDLAGKTLAIRVTISTIGFAIAIYYTNNLIIASVVAILISVAWFIIYDLFQIRKFENVKWDFDIKVIKNLLKECAPLFACAFMIMYIFNAPKYAIDNYMSEDIQGYYSILFMPASVVNLFSIFLFRPMMTTLANCWVKKELNKFKKIINGLTVWICILTILTLVGTYFLGIPILSVLYSIDLQIYKNELLIIMLGGGLSALATVFYYLLTVMRKQKSLLGGYAIAFISSIIISPFLVKENGIYGGALAYLIVMIILVIIFMSLLIFYVKNANKRK